MSMSQQTAIGEALTRAGADIGKTRLYNTAVDLLRSCQRNPIVAHDSFVEALEADSPMLAAMLGHEEVAKRALEYLNSVAGDMSGKRGGGHTRRDAQTGVAPALPSDDDGQCSDDAQPMFAAPSDLTRADGGRAHHETLHGCAPAGADLKHPGAGHDGGLDTQGKVARPRVRPNPPRGLAAISAASIAIVTVMDTYRIDGRSIGDWTIGEALAAGREKSQHGALLLALGRRYANASQFARVRDTIKVEDLQREIQRASEVADAA